jgi:hypothetical protein
MLLLPEKSISMFSLEWFNNKENRTRIAMTIEDLVLLVPEFWMPCSSKKRERLELDP